MKNLKNIVLLSSLILMIYSCKNLDLPSVEESEKSIAIYKPAIETADKVINSKKEVLSSNSDVQLKIPLTAFNKLTNAFSNQRVDDVNISFLQTRPFIKEDKNVLGIKYSNYLDIDTGKVVMNLKKLQLNKIDNRKLEAQIEIEGKGKISISGKYTGIPASASPEVDLYLNEWVTFKINPTDSGYIVFQPDQKKLYLHTKIYVKFLEWKIPWSYDVPMELTDLLKPIPVPIAFSSDIMFPLPASEIKGEQSEKLNYVPYTVKLTNTNINSTNNRLEMNSKILFKKK